MNNMYSVVKEFVFIVDEIDEFQSFVMTGYVIHIIIISLTLACHTNDYKSSCYY